MKIAQVSPPWFPVPPVKYGGAEMSVYLLTEQLVKMGHDVTLFASGDSTTSAKLCAVSPKAVAMSSLGLAWTESAYTLLNYDEVIRRQKDFDVINFHLASAHDYSAIILSGLLTTPAIFTLRSVLPSNEEIPGRAELLRRHAGLNYVSISNKQRKPIPELNWRATIYNCVNADLYHPEPKKKDYALWVGEIQPPKGTHLAIEAAKKAGLKIILAGRITPEKKEYFDYWTTMVKPHIDGKQVEYVGETTRAETAKLMAESQVFLNPICWEEPFGLVMIESLSCGTPVISFPNGAAPEIISDGQTGFLVPNVDTMSQKIAQAIKLDSKRCRQAVLSQFLPVHTASKYIELYQCILK